MRIFRAAVRCVLASAAMAVAADGQTKVDLRTQGRDIDFSAAGTTRPSKTGTVLPGTCSAGETFLKTDAAAGKNLYVCTAPNVWTVQGVEIPDQSGRANQVLTTDGTAPSWSPLGGDVGGRPGAMTVTGLNGRKLGSLTPLDGQYLRWNGVASQWEPVSLAAAFSVFGRNGAVTAQTGDYTFAQIGGSVAVTQLPSTGGDLNGTLTGVRVTGLQNRPVGASVPSMGQALVWDGTQWSPQAVAGGLASVFGRTGAVTALTGDYSFGQISGTVASGQLPGAGGDLSGTLSSATVGKLQNRPLGTTAPSTGQVLGWDGYQWVPQFVSGGNMANAVDRSMATTYTAGAKQTFVAGVATSGIGLMPGALPLVPAAGDLALDSQDANKLKVYDGSQWNTLATSTNYVSTFTSQTSLLVLGSSHKLGTSNLLVDCYDASNPAQRVEPDSVLVDPLTFNVIVNFTGAQTGKCVISGQTATGSEVGGAAMSSQLGDLSLVMTLPTVLTAGLNCSPATPCNVRMGSSVISIVTSVTVTLSAGTGVAYLYVDPSGVLTVGHNLTLACSLGCTAVSGVTSFPVGSLPLYSWTATNGIWDANGGYDRRAFLSTRNISAGAGMVTLDLGAQTVVAVDSATVPSYLTSTATLDFASLSPGGCGEMTFALAGSGAGDSIAPGWPAAMEGGLIGMMRVSAAGTVAVRVCNLSGTALDPAAGTYRATVVRSF